jgi:hypothetical protein
MTDAAEPPELSFSPPQRVACAGMSIKSDSTYRGVTYDGAGNELSYVATRSYCQRP